MTYIKPLPAKTEPRSKLTRATFLFLIFLNALGLLAQERTTGGTSSDRSTTGLFVDRAVDLNKVLVVPFEDRMYRSVADPGAMRDPEAPMSEFRDRYRKALVELVNEKLEDRGIEPQGGNMDIELADRIYNGLGYKSEKVEWPEEERKGPKKFIPKKKEKPVEGQGTFIANGQVKTVRDTSTMIMVPVMIDPALQPWMQEESGAGRTLFLTQFEIVPKEGLMYAGYGLDTATCIVQVHCSVFEEKKNMSNTLIKKNFRPCYSGQDEVIEMTFGYLAIQIAELFTTKEE